MKVVFKTLHKNKTLLCGDLDNFKEKLLREISLTTRMKMKVIINFVLAMFWGGDVTKF